MLIQTKEEFDKAINEIYESEIISIDTETTGLQWYKSDRPFCLTISNNNLDYYFDLVNCPFADIKFVISVLRRLFRAYDGLIFVQNAKFDMHMLDVLDIDLSEKNIQCTWAMGRLEKNNRMSYSLDRLASEIGHKKDDTVKKYLDKNKLYAWISIPGRKTRDKKYDYSKVPLELMLPYAEKDTRITYELGKHQIKKLEEQGISQSLIDNEKAITKVFYDMEKVGVKIDLDYLEMAVRYEEAKKSVAEKDFNHLCGHTFPFVDSALNLVPVFEYLGINKPPVTDKGNESFAADWLRTLDHPIADTILQYREATKRIASYASFKYYASNGVVHCDMMQAGTATGRISISNPALQCIEKPDEDNPDLEPYNLRGCFVPRTDYCFVMMDFDQFEYRMMLNVAHELPLIEKVKGGLDVHTATAEMMGVTRKQAKTLNFMLLYGGGTQKLADTLKISYDEAASLKQTYFEKLPMVQLLFKQVMDTIKFRGYLRNLFGRRYYFDQGFEYKGVNYLIQGSTADWLKLAMVKIHKFLLERKSRLLLQIHDELVFEVHKSELDIIPTLKHLMENVTRQRPHNLLPYTVGVDISQKSWKDKEEWKQDQNS